MPADDVAALLDRWGRARTRSQQLQVAAAGARTLRSSSPTDRRVLAQALVERGLPEAAAQLGAASSGRLTAPQLADLVGTLRDVDPATLQDVARSVADPAEHGRLLAAATGQPAPPAGRPAPPPPSGAPTGPAVALPPPVVQDERPELDHLPGRDDLPEVHEVADAPEVADLPDVADVHEVAQAPGVAEVADLPAMHEPSRSDGPPAPDAPPPVDIDGVLRAVARAPRVLDRLREVTHVAGAAVGSADLVALLRALPDGWQRRTAAKRLLEAGGVRDVDAAEVLAVLQRPSDRTAVARVLVAAGLTDVATVADHLEPGAAARLRRRAGR